MPYKFYSCPNLFLEYAGTRATHTTPTGAYLGFTHAALIRSTLLASQLSPLSPPSLVSLLIGGISTNSVAPMTADGLFPKYLLTIFVHTSKMSWKSNQNILVTRIIKIRSLYSKLTFCDPKTKAAKTGTGVKIDKFHESCFKHRDRYEACHTCGLYDSQRGIFIQRW